MTFPSKSTKHFIVSELFNEQLGHAGASRVAKFTAYPMTKDLLDQAYERGDKYIHIITKTTKRSDIKDYPFTATHTRILPINEAFQLFNSHEKGED